MKNKKLKWQCPKCKDIVVSDSSNNNVDSCKCKETSLDFNEKYIGAIGNVKILGGS